MRFARIWWAVYAGASTVPTAKFDSEDYAKDWAGTTWTNGNYTIKKEYEDDQ